ncbi:hypothetical protein [Mycobacterium marinum]|uniref:hypothetical protein n=1 Tax=Mycobacterium marinum TaxID=1781 RepID=UPI000B96301D|nr:hypothetical protein [Mycobacterium marinum]
MTTPMPGFEAIDPIAQPKYFRLRITDDDAAQDALRKAIKDAVAKSVIAYTAIEYRTNRATGQTSTMIKLTDNNGTDYFGDIGDSLVLTYHGDALVEVSIYNGPDGVRTTNRAYSELFPADPKTTPEPEPEPDPDPVLVADEPQPSKEEATIDGSI